MKRYSLLLGMIGCLIMAQSKAIVIAHRGASGYLPEHTLESTAMAYAMGADFIEPDIVLTKDNIPIVLHDIHLEYTTNVREDFPQRVRKDGHWYAIDFTLADIKTMNVHERVNEDQQAVYPNRFPLNKGSFQIPTFAEQIEMVLGLNKSTGRNVGIYPEIKEPFFHEKEGHPIGTIVLKLLAGYGYTSKNSNIFLQCFEPEYLKKLRFELKSELPMIQLVGPNEWEIGPDYESMLTKTGIKEMAQYANGIGILFDQIYNNPTIVQDAHQAGLLVHAYTFRKDELPSYVKSFDELLKLFFEKHKVGGVFTDFPDEVVRYLK